MSGKDLCSDCCRANWNRTNNGKIRCVRYSKWVFPFEDSCEEYISERNVELLQNMLRQTESMEENNG